MAQTLLTTANVTVSRVAGGFRLRFAYNSDAVRAVKSAHGARWNQDARCWALPDMSRDALQAIIARVDACFAAENAAQLADACVGQEYSPADLLRDAAEAEAREVAEMGVTVAGADFQREIAAAVASVEADEARQRRFRRTGQFC